MIKVAIVEDHTTTRERLETIVSLSNEYRCVCTCGTAEEGLRVLPGHEPMSGEIARKVINHFQAQSVSAALGVEKLSVREREVLDQVVHGFANKEIADRLGVSVEAIRWHLKHIYNKLHVHSRTEAALKYR